MSTTMFNVVAATDPVFIPHSAPERRHLVVKAVKYHVINKAVQRKVYELHFWGQMAEDCAHLIRKGQQFHITGVFRCLCKRTILNKVWFSVTNYVPAVPQYSRLTSFDMKRVLKTGRFGNARVWIRGQGLIEAAI